MPVALAHLLKHSVFHICVYFSAMTNSSTPASSDLPQPDFSLIHWTEGEEACSARWRSERGAPPPKRVVLGDDTTTADTA